MVARDLFSEQDYQNFVRRRLFERLAAGTLSAEERHRLSAQLGLGPDESHYAIFLLTLPPDSASGVERQIRSGLLGYFYRYPHYLPIPWEPGVLLVLVKGTGNEVSERIRRCLAAVQKQWEKAPDLMWHIAAGSQVEGVEHLPACYQGTVGMWACRYLFPGEHILLPYTSDDSSGAQNGDILSSINPAQTDPVILIDFMERGTQEEIHAFVDTLLEPMAQALAFRPFCSFLLLNMRFAALRFAVSRGLPQALLVRDLDQLEWTGQRDNREKIQVYLENAFSAVLSLRDGARERHASPLGRALDFIDRNFAESSLSLEQAARQAKVTPNYLSALFRQELDCTFVDYLTQKRMERARELLCTTNRRSGEIARAVGYRDPRYFSTLFKKAHGRTPRDFRIREAERRGPQAK